MRYDEVVKFLRYIFDGRAFRPQASPPAISEHARATAAQVRGAERGPAILIHGMSTRSGTVYVGELLRQHPDLFAFPKHVWEFPLLQHSHAVERLQQNFLLTHEQNFGKIAQGDLLPLVGASLIAYLYRTVPAERRILLKTPSVERLDNFPALYPHEHLLLLTRDGRDLVHSTVRTWREITFEMACLRWRRAARMVMAFDRRMANCTSGYMLGRFEDAVNDPDQFVRQACIAFDLDVSRYPFKAVDELPVQGSSSTREDGAVTWEPQEKRDDFRPIGHWQGWSRRQKFMFKRIAGRELVELGYAANFNW